MSEFLLAKQNKLERMKIVALFFVVFLFSITGYSQDCSNLVKKCSDPDKSFKVSASSRGIKMRKGKRTTIVLNAFKGREYFFSTFSRPKVGKIHFRIIVAESKQILYDNSVEGLVSEKKFKTNATQKLLIQIAAPNWKSEESFECIAFKIAYRNQTKG